MFREKKPEEGIFLIQTHKSTEEKKRRKRTTNISWKSTKKNEKGEQTSHALAFTSALNYGKREKERSISS